MKSQDEFYLGLHAQLIRCDPLETSSSKKLSFERDLVTLRSRVTNEGLAFLTKTLPLLGKHFDRALVSGRFNIPLGFKRSKLNASIPAFLQAYFNLVFDEDGLLRNEVPVGAVRHIRQVLFVAYKLKIPYSKEQELAVIRKFELVDENLDLQCDPLASEVTHLAKIITGRVFNGFNHKDIQPRHGPGAVATGEKLDQKWVFSRLYNSIHQTFPYYDYYVVGGARELSDRLDWYRSLVRLETGAARVVLVPKDSRGPRLISCEPLEYQWIQQGLGRKMAHFLEWDSSYTRHHVNFTRQEINRNLALASSASGRFVTLDLEDASDRVSLELVRRVFQNSPGLLRALEACRTTETQLPDGRRVTLNKFAPMGSALCFPVEAYVFWVIIVSAVVHYTNLPLVNVGNRVFVYGDDIVVPAEWATASIHGLESVGLIVNRNKSCLTGKFRESCGMDAFNGEDVTPTRLSTLWSNRDSDGSCLASYASIANKMAKKGYFDASDYVWRELETIHGALPHGTASSSFPCRIVSSPAKAEDLNGHQFRKRWNTNLQRTEYFLLGLSSKWRRFTQDGWTRLMRDLVSPPFGDPSVVVSRRSTKIKRRWTRVN